MSRFVGRERLLMLEWPGCGKTLSCCRQAPENTRRNKSADRNLCAKGAMPQIRNKLDSLDRLQVRLMAGRSRSPNANWVAPRDAACTSIAGINKEISLHPAASDGR
jgi:hypothetical protein